MTRFKKFVVSFSKINPKLYLVALPLLAFAFGAVLKHASASNKYTEPRWQSVQMRVTAYCPCPKCCGEYSDGVTANGHVISQGDRFVAADRRFGFNTQMNIPGYNSSNVVKVYDRGGAIKGNRLDVFFNTHQEALQWGVQHLEVRVFTDEKLAS